MIHFEQERFLSASGDPELLEPDDSDLPPSLRPETQSRFSIRSFWIPEDQCLGLATSRLEGFVKRQMIREVNGQKQFRLFVHPSSEVLYSPLTESLEEAEPYEAIPTASSRSLIVFPKNQPELAFIAKLSLDAVLGGVNRRIKDRNITTAIGHELLLEEGSDQLPRDFRWMPEVFGLIPNEVKNAGMLIRQIPRFMRGPTLDYIPVFSIISEYPEGSPPLLAQDIRRSKLSASDYLRKRLVRPFVKHWMRLALHYGVIMEAHGQNLMIAVNRQTGQIIPQFAHRDLNGFTIDLSYWNSVGLRTPKAGLPKINSINSEYHQRRRFTTSRESLLHYFYGGILYDIERAINAWKEKAWISRVDLQGEFPLADMLVEEVQLAYEKETGSYFPFGPELSTIGKRVKEYRCRRSLGKL